MVGRRLRRGPGKTRLGRGTELLRSKHMLTLPALRLGWIHSGCYLLLKAALCSHSQLLRGQGGGWSAVQDSCLF